MRVAEQGQEPPKGDPINDLETVVRLYLPELKDETQVFLDMHRLMVHEGRKLRIFLIRDGEDATKERKSKFADKAALTNVRESPKATAKLTEAARALLVKIMGVETQSEVAAPQNEVATANAVIA